MSTSVLIKVLGVDESLVWFPGARYQSYVRRMLHTYLRRSTPMTNVEARRLIRAVLAKEQVEITLADPQYCDPVCHWLTSLGATFELSGNPKLS